MLVVTIGEIHKDRTLEHVPVVLENAPRGSGSIAGYINVTINGPRSVVDQVTPEDIIATVDYRKDGRRVKNIAPDITLSSAYSDRVVLKSYEPKTLRVK
jgi:hypothetical protein